MTSFDCGLVATCSHRVTSAVSWQPIGKWQVAGRTNQRIPGLSGFATTIAECGPPYILFDTNFKNEEKQGRLK